MRGSERLLHATETAFLLAGQEPSIAEGGLAQSKVQGLASDLAAKATTASLASGLASKQDSIADGGLPQANVAGLVADLAARPSSQQLAAAIATREPLIADGGLAQSKVLNLTGDLAARALQADLICGLANKVNASTFAEANQQRINADALLEESIANLNTGLAGKQPTIARVASRSTSTRVNFGSSRRLL